MLNIILQYLPVLGIAIGVNILLGLYKNIGIKKFEFNWDILFGGVVKAICIAATFIGLAYCFSVTGTVINLAIFELNPETIITSAIALYIGKALVNLAAILGVSKDK